MMAAEPIHPKAMALAGPIIELNSLLSGCATTAGSIRDNHSHDESYYAPDIVDTQSLYDAASPV